MPIGDPSLQNALNLALNSLSSFPKHISREIIFLFGSLYTCDPSDIFKSIERASTEKCRINVVGIDARVKICEELTASTNGILYELYIMKV